MEQQLSNIQIVDESDLKSKIYFIRGQRVMLDADLAEIYGYETKRFNEQVKRNIKKFDIDFMFQLDDEEVLELSRSQNATLNKGTGRGKNIKYNPYVFTEQGIYIIDNYIGLKTLELLRAARKNVKIIVFSDNIKNKEMLTKNLLDDFKKEYPEINLTFKLSGKKYHDRYLAIDYGNDNETFYLCGSSSKDAGKRISSIVKIEDSSKGMYNRMFESMINNRELII